MHRDPLTKREALIILESLYDIQLQVEQIRREQNGAPEDDEKQEEWQVCRSFPVVGLCADAAF